MRLTGRSAALLLLLLLLVFSLEAAAQDGRVDVTLVHTGTDSLGKRLALSLRTELAASKRINLVKTSDERIGVYLATMATGHSTVYSATWTLGGMADDGYLTSRVGICHVDAIRACARSLLAETDRHATELYSVHHQLPAAAR